MAFVPSPGTWQVEIRGTLHGNEYENVMYFQRGPEGVSPASAAEVILDWLQTDFRLNFADQLVWDEIYMTDLTTNISPTYTLPISPPVTGGNSSETAPGNVCLCISFHTAGRGRSSRGRNYYGGLAVSEISGNSVDAARASDIRDSVEVLRALMLGDGWQHVVLSRETAGAPRVVGLVQPVTAIVLTNRNIDSQRRRLDGRGN